MVFSTDDSLDGVGFRLRFDVHNCGGNLTSETEIRSPLHPAGYMHNADCVWKVTAPEGQVVSVK